ncbi:MAG: DUF5671 domain-containing protein [Patescibacteria group bacterium]
MKTTPKDFFLHLAATVALYVSAGALINLSLSVVDYMVPDKLAGYFYAPSIAWPISMLVVLIPALYIIEWFIHQDYRRMPEKMTLWIRRWRIHLTLFLAGATIIGDLIALINTYLNGEISMRFFYKVVAVFIIAGVIFAYYLFDRRDATTHGKKMRYTLAGVGLLVVLAAIILGFTAVGSPSKQRAIRFDNQRVSDLQNIQWQVLNQWQTKGAVPVALSELADSLSGYMVPTDPDTKAAYEYTKKSNTSFELCSTFSLATQDLQGRGAYGGGGVAYPTMSYPYPGDGGLDSNWKHESGRTCFTRTIDPQKYPVNTKPLMMQAVPATNF